VAKKERGNAKGQFPKNAARISGGSEERVSFQWVRASDYRVAAVRSGSMNFQSCVVVVYYVVVMMPFI